MVHIQNIWKSEYGLLLILWLILTVVNSNKAFHIDDTFHIESAMQLLEDPLHPMSAKVNWSDTYHYLSESNHPPLFYYFIAVVGGIFSFSELPLHALLSVFTFLCLYYFMRIAQQVSTQLKLLLLLFAFTPPFIINQNLLLDVPLLACILGSIYFLFKGMDEEKWSHYLLASSWFTMGMMMKYSILPLFPLLIIHLLLHRKYKKLSVLLIPIAIVGLYSLWNYLEYGSTQLFDRSTHQVDFNLTANFLACSGAVSTFLFSLSQGLFEKYKKAMFISLIGFIGLCFFWGNSSTSGLTFLNEGLMNVFPIIGGFVFLILVIYSIRYIKKEGMAFLQSKQATLLIGLLGFTFFFILFPQFMASRHLLIVVPFILLFAAPLIEQSGSIINGMSVILSLAFCLLLGISDWHAADYYRKMAVKAKQQTGGISWSMGHWGWQWYSKKAGMYFFDSKNELALQKGEYVVYPGSVPKQPVSDNLKLEVVDKLIEEANWTTFFSGKDRASFYNSSTNKPMWNLSRKPVDTIYIAKVVDEISIADLVEQMKNDSDWLLTIELKAMENNIPLDSMLIKDAKWMKSEARRQFNL